VQTSLFLNYPRAHQPILQALFAIGAVVAPATITPILQGWLIDNQDWTWIFFSVAPLSLVAVSLLLVADAPQSSAMARRAFDWTGLTLISISFFSLTYVFSEGSRWRWFDEPHVIWFSVLGASTLLTFLGQQMLTKGQGVLDFGLFKSDDFCFALVVSVVAGAALLGSAYLIPSFAVAVLAFRPTDAGLLLLPSGALFVLTLLIAAYLIQARRVRPIATVPAGILIFMIAMWMLSGSTSESGARDMTVAVLLRGLGLGFLFLSINLIAFSNLSKASLAYGVGLFSVGRQLGGLAGVGALQTLIDHNVTNSLAVLGARITVGTAAVNERLTTLTVMLTANGMDAVTAGRAAMSLLSKSLFGQSTVIAFDTAFSAVALLFVVAAPLVVSIKIGLARCAHAKSIP
jgi:DHA2 family multidrug resistance protein